MPYECKMSVTDLAGVGVWSWRATMGSYNTEHLQQLLDRALDGCTLGTRLGGFRSLCCDRGDLAVPWLVHALVTAEHRSQPSPWDAAVLPPRDPMRLGWPDVAALLRAALREARQHPQGHFHFSVTWVPWTPDAGPLGQ